jgi:hypothetical protein
MNLFISYSRLDVELARFVAEQLQVQGHTVFVDYRGIAPGQEFTGVLGREIDSSDAIIVLLSSRSVESHWVRAEIGWALRKRKQIVPVLLESMESIDWTAIFPLASLQHLDFRDGSSAARDAAFRDLNALLKAMPRSGGEGALDGAELASPLSQAFRGTNNGTGSSGPPSGQGGSHAARRTQRCVKCAKCHLRYRNRPLFGIPFSRDKHVDFVSLGEWMARLVLAAAEDPARPDLAAQFQEIFSRLPAPISPTTDALSSADLQQRFDAAKELESQLHRSLAKQKNNEAAGYARVGAIVGLLADQKLRQLAGDHETAVAVGRMVDMRMSNVKEFSMNRELLKSVILSQDKEHWGIGDLVDALESV